MQKLLLLALGALLLTGSASARLISPQDSKQRVVARRLLDVKAATVEGIGGPNSFLTQTKRANDVAMKDLQRVELEADGVRPLGAAPRGPGGGD